MMVWPMSYVLVLAAAVIPTIKAGVPEINDCLVKKSITFYQDLESISRLTLDLKKLLLALVFRSRRQHHKIIFLILIVKL